MKSSCSDWFTAAEVAAMALPDMPATTAGVIAFAEREAWRRPEWVGKRWRRREGRGGGFEYHWSLLPPAARLIWSTANGVVDEAEELGSSQAAGGHAAEWKRFLQLSDKQKEKAKKKLQALCRVQEMVQETGRLKVSVVLEVAAAFGVSKTAIYDWEKLVEGVERAHWLPMLAANYQGRTNRAYCSPEAWRALYMDYARLAAPNFSDCYRRIYEKREQNGWTVPSEETLRRRMDEVPPETLMLARYGREKTKRMFPALQRDRTVFHALEAVNADGHKWDVFVRWPDGHVDRPMMVGFQDLFSDVFLSWRVDRTENKYLIQLCFGDVVESFGIPSFCYLDNGRGFTAKSLTGGIKNRFRYKYREAEPDGIMKQLGVEVHFSLPYSGQSKPIERGFRDLAQTVAKDIRFAGAYCGNRPDARPEDCDPKNAVPLELFLQVVGEGIQEHNNRVGRRTRACGGKLSFKQAFDASYAVSPIRRAPPDAKQLWLLAADQVKPRAPDSAIHFYGNRYWAKFLQEFEGRSLTVRFDPWALHNELQVYHWDGSFLGAAPCMDAVGYNSLEASKKQARDRGGYLRNAKARHVAELDGMTAERLIALTRVPEREPQKPEARVIRPTFGNTALKARPAEEVEYDLPEDEQMLIREMKRQRAERGEHLGLVPDEETDADA